MVQNSIDEARAMAEEGNLEDAVRFSGEELARLDNLWRRAHNARLRSASPAESSPSPKQPVTDMAAMAVCHAEMLLHAVLAQDAYAVAVTAIAALAMENADSREPQLMLELTALACMALNTLAETDPVPAQLSGEEAREHFPLIITYCASMLYYWYAQTAKTPSEWHRDINPLLRTLIRTGAVQSPTLTIAAAEVSPADTAAILPDLLGRSMALGLLQ